MGSGIRRVRCGLCGQPMEQKTGKGRKRKWHSECKRLSNYLDAAGRALEDVKMVHGFRSKGDTGALRARIFDLANAVPRKRTKRGTFVREEF